MLDLSHFHLINYGVPVGVISIASIKYCNKIIDTLDASEYIGFNFTTLYDYKYILNKNEKVSSKNINRIVKEYELKPYPNIMPSSGVYYKYFKQWQDGHFTKEEEDIIKTESSFYGDSKIYKKDILLNHYYKQEIQNSKVIENEIIRILNTLSIGKNIFIVYYGEYNSSYIQFLVNILRIIGANIQILEN